MSEEDLDAQLAKLRRLKQLQDEMGFVAAGEKGVTPKEAVKDLSLSLLSGLAQGGLSLAQLPSLPHELFARAGSAENYPYGKSEIFNFLEKGKQATQYRPKSTEAGYTKSIMESVPAAALGPGGLGLKAASAVGSGVGAEALDNLVDPKGDNALARVAGSLVGGIAPWTIAGKSPNAQQLVHESLSSTTPGDFVRANRLAKELADHKINSFLNSQLLGPRSTLDDLVVEASAYSHTRPRLETQTVGAPKEAKKALDVWFDKNVPPQMESRRTFLGDIKQLTTDKQKELKDLANFRYGQKMPQPIEVPGMTQVRADYPVQDMMDMHRELMALARSAKHRGGGGADLEAFVRKQLTQPDGLPVTNRWELNNIYKNLNAIKEKEGWLGLPDADLKKVIKKYTPDFDAARQAASSTIKNELHPMQQGLTGEVSRIGGEVRPDRYAAMESAFNRIFPLDRNQSTEILQFAKDIGEDEFAQFFGEYLKKAATKNLNRASGLDAPYQFTLDIARSPEQMANINTALKIVAKSMGASPQEVAKGFSNLMRAFNTYQDLVLAPGLNRADIGARAGVNLFGVVIAPHSRAGRASYDLVTRKTYQQIVDMVTSPDGLKQLEYLARHKPTSARMKAVVEGLLQMSVQGLVAEDQTSPLTKEITEGAK